MARAQSGGMSFVSPEAALEQGIGAYRGGFYQHALPGLTFAADKGLLLGQYHLAMLYADNASATTDHVKAYNLFLKIVEKNSNKINDDDELAPFVGRSLTALARYLLRGLPEHNLSADAGRAAEYLQVAETFCRDPDARFELAKMYLKGEGLATNQRQGLGRLTALMQDGHVGATAFFAELLWRGTTVKKDEDEAMRLIVWAVGNAPAAERIWIDDIYRSIYCGASAGVRKQAEGQIAGFQRGFVQRAPSSERERDSGLLTLGAIHSCDNGEPLPLPAREGRAPTPTKQAATPQPAPPALDVRGAQPPSQRR